MASGEGSYDFPAVYFIGILDFSFHDGSDQVLYRYQIQERNSHELMTDRIQFIFLELTNCRLALTPEASVLDNFCYVLHNMENLPDRPAELDTDLFRLLFESAEIATFTPQEKIKYEFDMTTERDIKNQIATAKEIGWEEGREEGMSMGRESERRRIVEALRSQGVSEDIIAKAIATDGEE